MKTLLNFFRVTARLRTPLERNRIVEELLRAAEEDERKRALRPEAAGRS